MSDSPFIHTVIVPDAIRELAEGVASSLGLRPSGAPCLNMPLVPVGSEDDAEATHWMGNGPIPEAARVQLEAGFTSGHFPGAMWWRRDAVTNELLASHLGEAETHIGEVMDWPECIAAAGLQERTEGDVYPPDPA